MNESDKKFSVLIIVILIIIFGMNYSHISIATISDSSKQVLLTKNILSECDYEYRFIGSGTIPQGLNVSAAYCPFATEDRRRNIENQLEKLGIAPIMFKAIMGNEIPLHVLKEYKSWFLPKSKLGVTLSFLACCVDAYNRGFKNFMFFEDDIIVDTNYTELIQLVNSFNNSQFNICYMGYCFLGCNQVDISKMNDNLYPINSGILCKHALLIDTSIVPILCKYLLPMNSNGDEILSQLVQSNVVRACVSERSVFYQDRKTFGSLNKNYASSHKTCNFAMTPYESSWFNNLLEL